MLIALGIWFVVGVIITALTIWLVHIRPSRHMTSGDLLAWILCGFFPVVGWAAAAFTIVEVNEDSLEKFFNKKIWEPKTRAKRY